MKILFVILAHNQPAKVAELARTVTAAATDAHAIIHFDANSSKQNFVVLEESIQGEERISLVSRRIACRWGDYSLVDAVLGGLREQKERGYTYDYVVLLSGACLPCRPIKQLERFFEENYGKEFIEAHDENWMIGGLRKERFEFYWPFPPSPSPTKSSHYWTQLQRFLRIKRKAPLGLEVRFGSQWWALTWATCSAMIDFMDDNQSIENFFRKTYIPDEMMINTLVWRLVDRDNIAGFGLTYFHFTNYGKPIVFFDDHEDYPFSLNKFFYRKVSDEAGKLRQCSLAKAMEEDDGSDLSTIGAINKDYFVKVKAQTEFPIPGQMYYRDQFLDMRESVLRRDDRRYIFVCGTEDLVQRVLESLDIPELEVVGRIFSKNKIQWFGSQKKFEGLNSEDVEIRNLHPLLYLQRARQRAKKIPVFGWVPGDLKSPLDTVLYDTNACIISMPPMASQASIARQSMGLSAIANEFTKFIPGVKREYIQRVELQMVDIDLIPERLVSAIDKEFVSNVITCPIAGENDLMHIEAEKIFKTSLENNIFRFEPWMLNFLDFLQCEKSDKTREV